MKKIFNFRIILCWIICIGTYWVTAFVYPHSCYYNDARFAYMNLTQILVYLGITVIYGTVMFFLLLGLDAIGRYIGMKHNLLLYFLYHFVFCTAFAFVTDKLYQPLMLSPYWIYLLIGFFPATMYSVIYSYHASHLKQEDEEKQNA